MIKDYSKRTVKKPFSSTKGAKINLKLLITVAILIFIFAVKLLPLSQASDTLKGISSTTTDFISMAKEIGEVIKKHTIKASDFALPCDFAVTSPFGERADPITNEIKMHFGIDYGAPLFSDVKCALNGVVSRVEENEYYGKFVMIKHSDDTETLYGHLKEAMVNIGDTVKKGEIIAKSGDSGKSTGAHLHFEIRKSGTPVNPEDYL